VGPAHNVALMNKSGDILYPTIHWSDLRSSAQCEWLERWHGDRIFKITYQRVHPSWTLSQLLWLKENEPRIWPDLRRILVTKDYVRYRFTGTYETDVYDAIGTQLYDIEKDCWSEALCSLLGFSTDWLPVVSPITAVSGELLPDAAGNTGLKPGVPIAVGSGDSVVEAFGIGVVDPGQCIVKLGSAANVNIVTDRPLPSPFALTYRHVMNDRWFTITPTNSGASTMRWFRDTFCRGEESEAERRGISAYDLIGELTADIPAGCEGLIFHPYLMGERSPYWDPHLRGDFIGISAGHRVNHFARAVLEGVAFSIRDCIEEIAKLAQPVSERWLLGGGAKSEIWIKILCDVLGMPLVKPKVDDASFGAGLLAGVAVGTFPDTQAALKVYDPVERILHPEPKMHQLYSEYFDIYRHVTHDLSAHNHRLVKLAGRTRS
jgi:xylulokinase